MNRGNEDKRRLKPIKDFLGQFILIVVSVLVALAVDKWNTERDERLLTEQYINSLTSELNEDISLIDRSLEWLQEKELASSGLLRLIRGEESDADDINISQQIEIATDRIDPPFSSGVFEDLKSTGNLRLLKNLRLRQSIINYYVDLAKVQQEIALLNNIVSGLAPTWLAIADQFSKEEFFGEKSIDPRESVNRLKAKPEVVRFLMRTRKIVAKQQEILLEARDRTTFILKEMKE